MTIFRTTARMSTGERDYNMIDAGCIISTMAKRGVVYPGEHLARYLRWRVQRVIDTSPDLDSVSAVARWLQLDRTGLHHYMNGRRLPGSDDEIAKLARLPDADAEGIRRVIRRDKLQALAVDEDMDEQELMREAAQLARVAGMSKEELIRLLQETDLEELERALRYS